MKNTLKKKMSVVVWITIGLLFCFNQLKGQDLLTKDDYPDYNYDDYKYQKVKIGKILSQTQK